MNVRYATTGSSAAGFTLVELVIVMVVVAIISVFAVSRLSGGFARTRGVYDQLLAQLQQARKTAVAQRRVVCVHLSAAQSQLYYGTLASCPGTTGVASPAGPAPFTVNAAAAGASIAPVTSFQFDALGRYLTSAGAAPGANLVVTVTGDGVYALTVERESGYVHP